MPPPPRFIPSPKECHVCNGNGEVKIDHHLRTETQIDAAPTRKCMYCNGRGWYVWELK